MSNNESLIQTELEAWIITELVTKTHSINPGYIISNCPQQLAIQIPNERQLEELLFNMEAPRGMLQRHSYANFQLTGDGLLEYRKYIHPLWEISQNKKKYEEIIDKIPGDKDAKKDTKNILKQIKDLTIEQAYEILIEFLKQSRTEAVYYIIKLITEMSNSSNIQ